MTHPPLPWESAHRNDTLPLYRLCPLCAACIPRSPLLRRAAQLRRLAPTDPLVGAFLAHPRPPPEHYAHHATASQLVAAAEGGCHVCALLVARGENGVGAAILREEFGKEGEGMALAVRPGRGVESLAEVVLRCWHEEEELVFTLREGPSARDLGYRYDDVEVCYKSLAADELFSQAWKWFDDCVSNHPECQALYKDFKMPTRLLDLRSWSEDGLVKLVITKPREPKFEYVAVSYCWGGPQKLKLTKETEASLIKGVALVDFPATLRDAMYIAHRLGLYYIWIDAICIVQDDPAVTMRECGMMQDIYGGSSLVISALSSDSCESGMLLDTPTVLSDYPYKSPTDPPFYLGSHNALLYSYTGSKLGRRAWTLQEQYLSPRSLCYSSHGTQWECRRTLRSGPATMLEHIPRRQDLPMLFKLPLHQDLSRFDPAASEYGYDTFIVEWTQLLRNYTVAELSFDSDKLNALAGMTDFLQTRMDFAYVAGLWDYHLPPQLLWEVVDKEDAARPEHYRAPSFSWAAIDGNVEIAWPYLMHTPLVDESEFFEVVELSASLVDPTIPNRPLSGAHILVRGPVLPAAERKFVLHRAGLISHGVAGGQDRIKIEMDVEGDELVYGVILLALLSGKDGSLRRNDDKLEVAGLVLAPQVTEVDVSYRRLGVFKHCGLDQNLKPVAPGKSWLDLKRKEIKIV